MFWPMRKLGGTARGSETMRGFFRGDPTGGVNGACLHCVGAPRARSGDDEELNAALLQRLEVGAGFYALPCP